MTIAVGVGLVFLSGGVVVLLKRTEKMMGQFEDLQAALAQMGTDLGEAITRVEAKIVALGDPDPDLTADIAALKDASAKLDALAADTLAAAPVEPAPPVEPPVEPPA